MLSKIQKLAGDFEVVQYGALSYDTEKYPLFALKTPGFGKTGKPLVLVTGGVHGYETSGVQGALRFLETRAKEYAADFDIMVAPCVSPWGYETVNRWNPNAVDPNRSFKKDTDSEEAAAVLKLVSSIELPVVLHMDLHEPRLMGRGFGFPRAGAEVIEATYGSFFLFFDGFLFFGFVES